MHNRIVQHIAKNKVITFAHSQLVTSNQQAEINQQAIEKPQIDVAIDSDQKNSNFLILFNDDFNTFDFVIESLVKVCKLDAIQAEQCTYLIHHKGKCDVKKGSYNKLKTMKDALIDRGLTAEIN